jgi:hypothetical protein
MKPSIGTRITACAVCFAAGTLLPLAPGAAAAPHPLLALRPGPIERPLSFVSTDFDRDGWPDLLVADFQAGIIVVLINQHDGTFAPHRDSPIPVGIATVGQPTSGPLLLMAPDLNPEDVDSDGKNNNVDNCPNVPNAAQTDSNMNGIGDDCEKAKDAKNMDVDSDVDGVPDYDPSKIVTPPNFSPAALDNCPHMPNPGQEDTNGDRIGDTCASSPDLLILETSLGGGLPTGIVRVKVNTGDGGTASRFSLATGAGPQSMTLGDFNGDLRGDLVVSNAGGDTLSLFSGKTDGTFETVKILTAGDGPAGLAAADFDGDGDVDLAVAERSAGRIGLYMAAVVSSTGRPALPTASTMTLATATAPNDLLTGRLDGDACADLVVLTQGDMPAGTMPATIDIFTHLICPGPLTPLSSTPLVGNLRPRGGLLLDLDGDAILDLAVAAFDGDRVLLYRGSGSGAFTPVPALTANLAQPAALGTLDYEAGGPGPDLAVLSHGSARLDLFVNNGGLGFTPAIETPASPWRSTSAMATFAADASAGLDIVLLQRSGRIDVLSGLGNTFFRPLPAFHLAAAVDAAGVPKPLVAASMAVGDLFKDGFLDLAVADTGANDIIVVRALASGSLAQGARVSPWASSPPSPSDSPAAPGQPAIGSLLSGQFDYDLDGVVDWLDDCPTRYNPPLCKVDNPACAVTVLCTTGSTSLKSCDPSPMSGPPQVDPTTMQCDSDQNGIGDICQLAAACPSPTSTTDPQTDTDGDQVPDYRSTVLSQVGGAAGDFDRDAIANAVDNCPTTSNASQADANGNGIGDACESLINGQPVDTDGDGIKDYDPSKVTPPVFAPAALDNCPTVYNPGQQDIDGDRVGNVCIVKAALDNCPWAANSTQLDANRDGIGDACAPFDPSAASDARFGHEINDLVAVMPGAGQVGILLGDGSGAFRPAPVSPVGGLVRPTAALVGSYTLTCVSLVCSEDASRDILIADPGMPGSGDDGLVVLAGNDQGSFFAGGSAAAQGDPDALLQAFDQLVCGIPYYVTSTPGSRFDQDNRTTIIAAVEPGTSTIGIYLPGNFGLVPPIAHSAPLPVSGPLVSAVMTDLNQDRLDDIVALSSGDGVPATPNLTIYIGLGNGLFFTDPTLNPTDVPDGFTMIGAGNADLASDQTYPDIELWNGADFSPVVVKNIMTERADIDGSGRVDGYDLALLASAFGATRGEDFTLQADGTLVQTGSGVSRVVVGSGMKTDGQDLPRQVGGVLVCEHSLQSASPDYGLPVDINLDGMVDGADLAILASRFAQSF